MTFPYGSARHARAPTLEHGVRATDVVEAIDGQVATELRDATDVEQVEQSKTGMRCKQLRAGALRQTAAAGSTKRGSQADERRQEGNRRGRRGLLILAAA